MLLLQGGKNQTIKTDKSIQLGLSLVHEQTSSSWKKSRVLVNGRFT